MHQGDISARYRPHGAQGERYDSLGGRSRDAEQEGQEGGQTGGH